MSRTALVKPAVLQIVPGFLPDVCGTGDYALNLARKLREDHDIDSEFLVLDAGWHGPPRIEGFAVAKGAAFEADALVARLEGAGPLPAVLHYEMYAYGRRGLPFWLVRALERWKEGGDRRRLLTVFHSLYAINAPWRSSFWLWPLQRRLTARLRRLTDGAVAMGEEDARLLARWQRGRDVAVLAVPSTMGEPDSPVPLAARSRRMVVFGKAATRERVYRSLARQLGWACRSLGIDRVVDVGPPLELPRLDGLAIEARGVLPAGEVSELLGTSLAGFFAYPGWNLAKSSVLAAYLAHGQLAVTGARYSASGGTPVAGEHFWACREPERALAPAEAQALADGGARWYRLHAHSSLVASVFRHLIEDACPCSSPNS
jgi:hypothetical protein